MSRGIRWNVRILPRPLLFLHISLISRFSKKKKKKKRYDGHGGSAASIALQSHLKNVVRRRGLLNVDPADSTFDWQREMTELFVEVDTKLCDRLLELGKVCFYLLKIFLLVVSSMYFYLESRGHLYDWIVSCWFWYCQVDTCACRR